MKKFVQILNNKAHWIFVSGEKPEFAANIMILDITGQNDVQEGWDYDEVTGIFTEPVYVEPEPVPPPDTTMEEYLIDLDFRLSNIELGL